MRPKLLLVGYSGKKNFGDDLLLSQAYDAFNEIAELHIHTEAMGDESEYLMRWFPKAIIFKSIKLNHQCLKAFSHVLYFGGGVFFDYHERGLKYYFRKRVSILKNYSWTKYQGTRFAGIGIGIGPFADAKSESLCISQLQSFDYLNVRDSISLELCNKHKLNKVSLSEDLSLANFQYYHSFKIPLSDRKNRVIVCPRKYPHGRNKDLYLKSLLSFCNDLKIKGKEMVVFGFQSDHDESVIEEFSKKGYETQIWDPAEMNLDDLLRGFADCEFLITARMHGLYIAGMLDVPVIGIGVHPKLKLASQLFSKSLCVAETFSVDEMYQCIQQLSGRPENDCQLLFEKETQCQEQYEVIKKWLSSLL